MISEIINDKIESSSATRAKKLMTAKHAVVRKTASETEQLPVPSTSYTGGMSDEDGNKKSATEAPELPSEENDENSVSSLSGYQKEAIFDVAAVMSSKIGEEAPIEAMFTTFKSLVMDLNDADNDNAKKKILGNMLQNMSDRRSSKHDIYRWLRFLLPTADDRSYKIDDTQLAEIFSSIFKVNLEHLLASMKQKRFEETIGTYFNNSEDFKPKTISTLTMNEVDLFLRKLSLLEDQVQRIKHFENIIRSSTVDDLEIIVHLVRQSLSLKFSAKQVMQVFHPDLYTYYKHEKDLKLAYDKTVGAKQEQKRRDQRNSLRLGSPLHSIGASAVVLGMWDSLPLESDAATRSFLMGYFDDDIKKYKGYMRVDAPSDKFCRKLIDRLKLVKCPTDGPPNWLLCGDNDSGNDGQWLLPPIVSQHFLVVEITTVDDEVDEEAKGRHEESRVVKAQIRALLSERNPESVTLEEMERLFRVEHQESPSEGAKIKLQFSDEETVFKQKRLIEGKSSDVASGKISWNECIAEINAVFEMADEVMLEKRERKISNESEGEKESSKIREEEPSQKEEIANEKNLEQEMSDFLPEEASGSLPAEKSMLEEVRKSPLERCLGTEAQDEMPSKSTIEEAEQHEERQVDNIVEKAQEEAAKMAQEKKKVLGFELQEAQEEQREQEQEMQIEEVQQIQEQEAQMQEAQDREVQGQEVEEQEEQMQDVQIQEIPQDEEMPEQLVQRNETQDPEQEIQIENEELQEAAEEPSQPSLPPTEASAFNLFSNVKLIVEAGGMQEFASTLYHFKNHGGDVLRDHEWEQATHVLHLQDTVASVDEVRAPRLAFHVIEEWIADGLKKGELVDLTPYLVRWDPDHVQSKQ